jgi:hypothetical protein
VAISQTLLLFIVGVGVLQAIFLAALLFFHPKSERSVNKFLAFYILCYCIPMLTPIVQHFFSWQAALIIIDPTVLLIGPCLYLYVCSYKEKITLRKAWPHFILFFLVLGLDTHLYIKFIEQYPIASELPPEVPHQPASMVRVFVRIGQMILYFFLAGKALTLYQHSIQHLFSETSRIDLSWVRWLINGYIILLILMIGFYFLILRNPENFGIIILINTALVTPYMYAVAFRGLTQPTLWQVRHEATPDKVEAAIREVEAIGELIQEHDAKNQKVTLAGTKISEIVTRATQLMKESKVMKDSVRTSMTLSMATE